MTATRRLALLTVSIAALLMTVSWGAPAALAEQERSAGPSTDGVNVHGHWMIEVHERDGRLVSRHEFDNELLRSVSNPPAGGNAAIAGFLGGLFSNTPVWDVILAQSGSMTSQSGGPCGTTSDIPCRLTSLGGSGFSPDLVVSVPTFSIPAPPAQGGSVGIPAGSLEISGSVTAGRSAAIGYVATEVSVTFPNNGNYPWIFHFSGRTLATPVQVTAGQIIQVKVVFSFS